jgi:hypothetical protein
MSGNTEYQVEYCGIGTKLPGSSSKAANKESELGCKYNEDIQPVGGRSQEKARQEAMARREANMYAMYGPPPGSGTQHMRSDLPEGATNAGLTMYESDFITTNHSAADQGTHRMAQNVPNSTLYNPAERDPPTRDPSFYMYRSSAIEAMRTGPPALAVPDVHKLRYMHGDYMTHDDWY